MAFVKDESNYTTLPITVADDMALIPTNSENLFSDLPQYKTLRKKYTIERLENASSAFDKALLIMNYLTRHTFYSGASLRGIAFDDGLNILQKAFDRGFKYAINCRFKAIALTDLLLANGIKAYPLLLLDSNKSGCHFMVHIYLDDTKQWIAVDPSFNCYFTDKDNNILNIYDLRNIAMSDINRFNIVGYQFNGTQECLDIYRKYWIGSLLTNISTWQDNSNDKRFEKFAKRKQFNAKPLLDI